MGLFPLLVAAVALLAVGRGAIVHPFKWTIKAPELAQLKTRIQETRWPNTQGLTKAMGINSTTALALKMAWLRKDFDDWSRRLHKNAFMGHLSNRTSIFFKHWKQPGKPVVLLLHGWPGSVFEFEEAVELLKDDYELVIPSLPGFGFSSHGFGRDVDGIVAVMQELMAALGYTAYRVQGGDWGAMIAPRLCERDAACEAVHVNFMTVGPPLRKGLRGLADCVMSLLFPNWWPEEPELTAAALNPLGVLLEAFGYMHIQATRPQTMAVLLNDSPMGLAAYMGEKYGEWSRREVALDRLLDSVTLYWFTNSGGSVQIYHEEIYGLDNVFRDRHFTKPAGYTSAVDLLRLPERWVRYYFSNLRYYRREETVGHFLAMEAPEVFAAELRAFFKTLDDDAAPPPSPPPPPGSTDL